MSWLQLVFATWGSVARGWFLPSRAQAGAYRAARARLGRDAFRHYIAHQLICAFAGRVGHRFGLAVSGEALARVPTDCPTASATALDRAACRVEEAADAARESRRLDEAARVSERDACRADLDRQQGGLRQADEQLQRERATGVSVVRSDRGDRPRALGAFWGVVAVVVALVALACADLLGLSMAWAPSFGVDPSNWAAAWALHREAVVQVIGFSLAVLAVLGILASASLRLGERAWTAQAWSVRLAATFGAVVCAALMFAIVVGLAGQRAGVLEETRALEAFSATDIGDALVPSLSSSTPNETTVFGLVLLGLTWSLAVIERVLLHHAWRRWRRSCAWRAAWWADYRVRRSRDRRNVRQFRAAAAACRRTEARLDRAEKILGAMREAAGRQAEAAWTALARQHQAEESAVARANAYLATAMGWYDLYAAEPARRYARRADVHRLRTEDSLLRSRSVRTRIEEWRLTVAACLMVPVRVGRSMRALWDASDDSVPRLRGMGAAGELAGVGRQSDDANPE